MKNIFLIACLIAAGLLQQAAAQIFATKEYVIFADSVVQQNKFTAKALSDSELISDYQSPANQFQSSHITFKFSINGKDNEMKPGSDHGFNCVSTVNETPVIKFGEQLKDYDEVLNYIKPDAKLIIKLDMRSVLSDFRAKGYYITYNGDKIFKEDFKGVYVAGATAPMTWDFDNLVNYPDLELKDPDSDGIYETTLILNAQKDKKQTASHWKLSKDISAFPQYHSGYPISNALYNLSLEEMINAVEPDSTFRTGKLWAGVWTRDISYSIILSMAYLQPRVAMKSLMRKVNKKGKIIQDTGTGGAYPVSTDRMIWATAAWEVYKATGDEEWLQQAYRIIKNSVDDDLNNAFDKRTGLMHGESSFLDWREQTYPKWMQPVDIYQSENLGTNAVHYQANIVLSEMATLLKHTNEAIKYKSIADKIKKGINTYLWMKDKGYYAQYLYGRACKIKSPRAEALGEALCVLFDIADEKQQQSIIENTPVTDYGISCIYPQIPNIPPYHNNAVWPFVESYWAQASAKVENEKSVMESIGAVYRPAAMFVTNKENFVADNGDFAGTQVNSSNMLWSLSGNISLIHKIIFGIHFETEGLIFRPFVPKALKGNRSLMNFKYRNAILNIAMEGYGNIIQSFYLDGNKLEIAKIPTGLTGTHTVKIIMADNNLPEGKINKVENYTSVPAPSINNSFDTSLSSYTLSWQPVEGAVSYILLLQGAFFYKTSALSINLGGTGFAEYQLIAVDKDGVQSFASEPLQVFEKKSEKNYEMEDVIPKAGFLYKGFSGSGFSETSKTVNTKIDIPVTIDSPGSYLVDFRYANGNGPINTSNKCAIRTLKEDNDFLGTIVLPQRGDGEWSNWGFTNSLLVHLTKGKHILKLSFEPSNENMNGDINQAMLDYMRIIRIK